MGLDLSKKIKFETEISGSVLTLLPMAIQTFVQSGAKLNQDLTITDENVLNEMMQIAQKMIDTYTANIETFKVG